MDVVSYDIAATGPEPADEILPPVGQSSFDFMYEGASLDTTPPDDQELRPPIIDGELAQPVYPPLALSAGAGSSIVAVRIMVSNSRQERNLRIELINTDSGQTSARVGRNLGVGQNQMVSVTLPVPIVSDYAYYQVRVYENGREITGLRQKVDRTFWEEGTPLLVISDRKEDLRAIGQALEDMHGKGYGAASSDKMLRQILPEEMPEGWTSYTQIGSIGVSARAAELMSRARRDDLRKWVATGGTLFIYRPLMAQSNSLELIMGQDHGASLNADARSHYFGSVRVVHSDPFAWTASNWMDFLQKDIRHREGSFRSRFGFEQNQLGEESRNFMLKIPGVGDVPVRSYAVIITIFALVIGPLNYFVLKKKRKLHLIFVITPAAAVLVTAGMVTYGLFSEGLGIKGKCLSLTYLDQQRHEAVSIGRMALYAGMSPSGGMVFGSETAVFPAAGEMGPGTLELGSSQRFAGGYLPSRTVVNFVTANVGPSRARLMVRRTVDGLEVANGLGVGIKEIHLMDRAGTTFRAEHIPAGAKAIAKPQRALNVRSAVNLGLGREARIPLLSRARLDKQCYLAELEDSPFFETGLKQLAESGSQAVLYGHFAEQSDDS